MRYRLAVLFVWKRVYKLQRRKKGLHRKELVISVYGGKEIDSFFKRLNEDIHLFFRIVEVEAGARTCIDT